MLTVIKNIKPKKVKLKKAYVIDKFKMVSITKDTGKAKLKKVKNIKALVFEENKNKYIFLIGDMLIFQVTDRLIMRREIKTDETEDVLLRVEKKNGVYRPVFGYKKFVYSNKEKELLIVDHFHDFNPKIKLFK